MHSPTIHLQAGAEAAAVPAPSPWRPLVLRTLIGALALLGLSGIGAASMLAGLDGAHASPPAAGSVWTAAASAAAGPHPAAQPSASPSTPQSSAMPAVSGVSASPEPSPCPTRTDDGRVILNLAGVEDLRKIPGIGPKRADAIVALRTKLKRFKRGADLLRVRGIGPKSLARMQSHFVIDAPAASNCSVPGAPAAK